MTGNTKTSGSLRTRFRPDTFSLSLPKHSLLHLLRDGFPKASSIHSYQTCQCNEVHPPSQWGNNTSMVLVVVFDSLRPHVCSQPSRLLCSWDSPGKNTGVGCHFLLQGMFATQGSNLGLPHCRQFLYHLNHQGSCRYHPIRQYFLLLTPWTCDRQQST